MSTFSLRGRALWEFVFDPDRQRPHTEALRQYKRRPGWFPTRKGPGKTLLLRTRDNLIHDFLYLAETDPDIVLIVDHPMEIVYWIVGERGEYSKSHISDLALGHKDGRITFVDVRRYWEMVGDRMAATRAEARERYYRDQFGSRYILHDERKIYPEPIFTNAKQMCELARARARLPKYARIREDIAGMALPMTVRQMMQASTYNAQYWKFEDDEEQRILSEINPVFETVMEMVAHGELWVDESLAFSIDTVVHPTELTGRRRETDLDRSLLTQSWEDGRGSS